MKKFFLTAAVLVAAVTTMSAQKQGEFTVGGNLGVSGGSSSTTISAAGQSETTKTPGTTSFLLAPQFSYFVIDNLEVSAGLEYDMSKEFYDNHNNKNYFYTTHIAMFTIGANYYIPLIEDKLFYTPGLQFGFGGGSVVSPDYNYDSDSYGNTTTKLPFAFGFSADLGKFEFKPVDFLGVSVNLLDFTVLYNTVETGLNDITAGMTNFAAGFNYGITAGVKYYF